MALCRVYSLRLRSPRPLWHVTPSVESAWAEPEIELIFSGVDEPVSAWESQPWSVVRERTGPGWFLSLATAPETCDFALRLYTRRQAEETAVFFGRGAARIVVHWRSERSDTEQFWIELSGWILGSVLGCAMCLRGLPTLHSSVAAVDGRAVGLLGASGSGKSTLAAAFLAAGHAVLADDHLVVGQDDRGYCALPGPPRLRLWPTSLPVLDAVPESPSFWANADGKRYVEPAAGAYGTEPLPLAAIYVLMPRDPARIGVAINDLPPAAALNALMNQRFCTAPLSATYTATSFAALAALAQGTPVRLLHRPQGLETLPEVVAAIRENVGSRVY